MNDIVAAHINDLRLRGRSLKGGIIGVLAARDSY